MRIEFKAYLTGELVLTTTSEKDLKELYKTYLHKILRPENALEICSDFVLDLINVFGDKLSADTPLKPDWVEFAPFQFILSLNELLAKYKAAGEDGYDQLSEIEQTILHDSHLLLSSLIKSALSSQPELFEDEEHFQIPKAVATALDNWTS